MSNEKEKVIFPQELVDKVLDHMRGMSSCSVFCAMIESAAAVPMSKALPNMHACKLLATYDGKAPYLLIMGKLLEAEERVLLAEVPVDSYEIVAVTVDAAHAALEKKGITGHTVWLTVSSTPTLINYFKRIMDAAQQQDVDTDERTLH